MEVDGSCQSHAAKMPVKMDVFDEIGTIYLSQLLAVGYLTIMARFKLTFFFILSVLLHAALLLPHMVHSKDEDEDNLLQGINSYRTSLNLQALTKNDKAGCLADEIANDLEDQPCSSNTTASTPQSANYNNNIRKCKIDPNTATDGVVLPVCVPKLVPTLVLTNYTHTPHARYLNNSKYTGVGVGSGDDWMVMVLSGNTVAGSFASEATSLVSKMGLGHPSWMALLLGLLLYLVYY
ncbi:hypothetical protein Pint_19900 [Pistacia integerrima]|uniref:Uncharacterized protein n=1 Tax=Pistacia integerrima TaxID=434235 RepID=A0ACC0XFC1_9ROSI|nr:hypothetical protein Pint_19900 [Pistacia integerrima]